MSKPGILHIIDSLPLGGAEKLLVSTINNLPGYDHHLIYLGGSNAFVSELPEDCKVSQLHLRSRWDIPRCAYRVRQYIRHHQIRIVHSHLVLATLVARFGCRREVKLFNTIHSLVGARFFGPGKRALRLLEKITYKKRHHIIAVSREVLNDYKQFIGIKGAYTILPNFIDDQYFSQGYKKSDFSEKFRIVTVGNLKPAKNYFYLLEAFRKLPKSIQLDIYGDGPMRNELQSVIDGHKLNIRLCGAIKNIQEVMSGYDLFVMSSSFEGHPLALLEAMALGMPAAVSDIPVLRETTGHKGIYFRLDDPADFVSQIIAIAEHRVDLDLFAKHNFELAKKAATREGYMKSLDQIYRNTYINSNLVNERLEYLAH